MNTNSPPHPTEPHHQNRWPRWLTGRSRLIHLCSPPGWTQKPNTATPVLEKFKKVVLLLMVVLVLVVVVVVVVVVVED